MMNKSYLRRRDLKGDEIQNIVLGSLVGICCAVSLSVFLFAAMFTWSYTSDLKRELAEARAAAMDSAALGVPSARRLGGTEGSTLADDAEGLSIIREMDEYMNRERLKQIAAGVAEQYKYASPFPNHVFDDIFPERILRKIMEEHPESALVDGCLPGSENCVKEQYEGQHLKSAINNDKLMGMYTKIFMGYIKSSGFVRFLEEVSGILHIVPDPHYTGAGLHFTSPGGKLDIHADFNAYIGPKLERRVNILIFLNDDWPAEYGGHLELWSRDMKTCSQKISPKLGRMAVFSTTDFSHHGHPHPLTAPEGRARRSIAMYYYTTKRPKKECLNNKCAFESDFTHWHSTLFHTPVDCNDCEDPACNALPDPNPFA